MLTLQADSMQWKQVCSTSYKSLLTAKHAHPQHSLAKHTSPSVLSAGSAGTVSWTALATIVTTPSMAVAMVVLGSLGTACSDVVVDSIVVERSRGEPQVISHLSLK